MIRADNSSHVLDPPNHLRMTWQPVGWAAAATLQIRFAATDRKRASLRFHMENLGSEAERERMHTRLRAALIGIAGLIEAGKV